MAGYQLIEVLKQRNSIESDNQAALFIGKTRQHISTYKNTSSKPDADTLLEIMIKGNISAIEAKALLNQKGIVTLNLVSLIATNALVCWATISQSLYIMLNSKTKSKA